jgi:transposase
MAVNKKRGGRSSGAIAYHRRVRVWRMHWRGFSARAIARQECVSHSTVLHYLHTGPPPGIHPPKPSKTDAKVIDIRRRAGTQRRNGDPAS